MEGIWRLSIEPSGAAEVTTDAKSLRFQLSEAACEELVGLIKRERFFELRKAYGTAAIDGATRQMNINLGKEQHSVILYEALSKDPDRDAVKRALRVWGALRGLFDLPAAADSRKEDQALLDR